MPQADPCGRDYPCNLLVGFTAGYDKAGNRLFDRHLHAKCRSHTYDYDTRSRLIRYRRGELTAPSIANTPPDVASPIALSGTFEDVQFDLGATGNWRSPTRTPAGGALQTEVRTHNPLNQITGAAGASLTYDGNGNLLSDGTLTYKYDALNRLKEVREGNALLATYYYDALGRRVKSVVEDRGGGLGGAAQNVPAGSTLFLYAGDQCVEERDGNDLSRVKRQYVWGQYIDELVQQREYYPNGGTQDFYPLSDLTYRTVALTDDCRCVVEAYDIDAYGRTLVFGEPGQDGTWFTDDDVAINAGNDDRPFAPRCRYLFTGREFDAESGLHYFRARHYSPTLGRFLQRDPLGYDAGDANLYAYCHGNPVVHTDPSGEIIPLVILGAIALLGAVHGGSSVYMADPNASGLSIAAGAALGGTFGLINPYGTVGSAVGSAAGYYGGRATGLWDPNAGYQWGGLAGGLSGGFRGGWKAGRQALRWEAAGGVAGASAGYMMTGTSEGALMGATLGMFAGGTALGATNEVRNLLNFKSNIARFVVDTNNEFRISAITARKALNVRRPIGSRIHVAGPRVEGPDIIFIPVGQRIFKREAKSVLGQKYSHRVTDALSEGGQGADEAFIQLPPGTDASRLFRRWVGNIKINSKNGKHYNGKIVTAYDDLGNLLSRDTVKGLKTKRKS